MRYIDDFFFNFFRKKKSRLRFSKVKRGYLKIVNSREAKLKLNQRKKEKKKVKLKSTWRIKFIIHRVYRAFHEFSLFS